MITSQAIEKRISVRNFLKKELDQETKADLKLFLKTIQQGPLGSSLRLELLESDILKDNGLKKLGTYGTITGTRDFLAGAVKQSQFDLEDFGYAMEKAILYATTLDLGTCWIGANFNKTQFTQALVLKDNEIIPAITPIGLPAVRKNWFDLLVHISAKSRNRKEMKELFFDTTFEKELILPKNDPGYHGLNMVRLAPSAVNLQPWRIIWNKQAKIFHLFLERKKGYKKTIEMMGKVDLQRIDMGIAMAHLEVGLNEKGVTGKWKKVESPVEKISEEREYIISYFI
ncbi:MAG: nitroreductase family protein [Spirochaetes bacterium]|nr:nitroreductase family protein [Spirochaetota bacterium]